MFCHIFTDLCQKASKLGHHIEGEANFDLKFLQVSIRCEAKIIPKKVAFFLHNFSFMSQHPAAELGYAYATANMILLLTQYTCYTCT